MLNQMKQLEKMKKEEKVTLNQPESKEDSNVCCCGGRKRGIKLLSTRTWRRTQSIGLFL